MKPPVALLVYPVDAPRARRRSTRSRSSRPSGRRSTTRWRAASRCASWTCRRSTGWPSPTDEATEDGGRRRADGTAGRRARTSRESIRSARWRWRRATPTASCGGSTQVEQRRDRRAVRRPAGGDARAARRAPGRARRARTRGARRTCARRIRAARRRAAQRIAVVCGAWHAPALAELGPAKPDAELLKGLPKIKIAATWIPWTASRLSYRSGYGAGVERRAGTSTSGRTPSSRRCAGPCARRGCCARRTCDASSASVIESVRLAEALAALRGLRAPGPARAERQHAGRAVRRRARAAGARARSPGAGRAAGRGPGGDAGGSAAPRAGGARSGACGSSAPTRQDARPRPARGDRPRAQPPAAPAAAAGHRLGQARDGHRQERDLPRALAAALAARAGDRHRRGVALGQHHRARPPARARSTRRTRPRSSAR